MNVKFIFVVISIFLYPHQEVLTLVKEASKDSLFSLKASSTWKEFNTRPLSCKKSSLTDKRILIGEIKLKSKKSIYLEELTARWKGNNLGNLIGSLYSKKITDQKSPIPIEDNLICDGKWNPEKKEFIFPIKKKLVASDTYYLMIHLPQKFEKRLKTGSFEITNDKKCAVLTVKK